jgi:hypothetical protein
MKLDFIEKEQSIGQTLMYQVSVKKRKANNAQEIVVSQFIVPLNKAKRLKVGQLLVYEIRRKRVKLEEGYLLNKQNKIIKASKKMKADLERAGYDLSDRIIRDRQSILPNIEFFNVEDNYNFKLFENPKKQQDLIKYNKFLKKNPIKFPSKKTAVERNRFQGYEDMRNSIKQMHYKQKNEYRLDIWIGYTLRNIDTGEARYYLPYTNTSIFQEEGSPLINLSLQSVLEKITSDNLIEKAKRLKNIDTFIPFSFPWQENQKPQNLSFLKDPIHPSRPGHLVQKQYQQSLQYVSNSSRTLG